MSGIVCDQKAQEHIHVDAQRLKIALSVHLLDAHVPSPSRSQREIPDAPIFHTNDDCAAVDHREMNCVAGVRGRCDSHALWSGFPAFVLHCGDPYVNDVPRTLYKERLGHRP